VTGDGPRGRQPKSPRHNDTKPSAPLPTRPATSRRQHLDSAWDIEMTRLLREAAEIREERDRARQSEDTLLARGETAALMSAIRTRGQPREKRYVLRPSAGRPRGAMQVMT
jgi:hypothetical protein